jgi:hypothetical protein
LLPMHAAKAAHTPQSRFCAQPRPHNARRVPKQENQKNKKGEVRQGTGDL